jgi:hypothetical protein
MHALLPPSPLMDRSSFAQNVRKKSLAGSSDAPPFAARVPAPPRQSSKKDRNIEADL